MINMHFEIDGKRVDPNNIADALERSILNSIADELRLKLGSIRDPSTGEFPTVVIRGDSLDTMTISVEGSEAVVALASARLGDEFDATEVLNDKTSPESNKATPNVFLCHASEDKPFVSQLACDLRSNGIEVFYDEWSIQPGESIRQRVDNGLTDCTHFVVVLTPVSLDKPWVNLEMDAGLVRKLNGFCRFVPLRNGLSADQLPPTLSGMLSPSIDVYEVDLKNLVGFFHGITTQPPLGHPPRAIRNSADSFGISASAKAVVDRLMSGTQHGLSMDPQLAVSELREIDGLTDEQIEDVVFELEGRNLVKRNRDANSSLGFDRIYPTEALFVEFDHRYGEHDPKSDAIEIAALLMNRFSEGVRLTELADALGWSARRTNPAICYLSERELIRRRDALGTGPFCASSVTPSHATRRFLNQRL